MQVVLGGVPLPQFGGSGAYGAGAYGVGSYGSGQTSGQPVLYVLPGLEVDDQINARTTCKLDVVDVLGSYRFPQGTALKIVDDTGLRVFGGFVADCTETKPSMSLPLLVHSIQGMDYHYLADKRVVATSYVAGTTCGAIVQDLITNWLGSEGVTVGGIQAGPALSGTVTYNYKPASYILDQVAQFANFSWFIDAYAKLWFFSAATFSAPWTFDGTQPGTFDGGSGGSAGVSIEHYNKGYRNSQYILGATEITVAQTEAHKGDGSTRAFPLGYPIHSQPSNINVNGGAAQTVGVQGTTGKQWYWQKGSSVLQQDSGQTVLASTDTLNVTYIGQYEVVAYAQDGNQVSIEQALEGIGSGVVEEATTDTKLTTAAQAFVEASGLLGEYSSVGTILTFKTTKYGLQASQMLTVNLPWGASTITGRFLIEKVILRYEPSNEVSVWWYDVTATQGPVSETWVQWFTRIVQPQASIVDVSSLGQQSQIVILQSGTVAWTWTVTGYSQLITYALPSPTSYPSPSIYPGSAGGQVAITWTKTNAGLNALAAALNGANNSPAEATYLAWGTGTQGTPATATQLANESGRRQVASLVTGASVGEEVITGQIGPANANGVAITEVAFFAGPSASGSANSGTMLLYGLYSHTKAASEAINIVADGTFS